MVGTRAEEIKGWWGSRCGRVGVVGVNGRGGKVKE